MIAGIFIDNWKLPIYHKHLDAAGYKYEKSVPFSTNTSILRVHYEKKEELSSIIQAAQLECDKKLS